MKRTLRVDQPAAPGERAGELDRRCHPFTAGTAKESALQAPACEPAQALGEFARQLRDMALQHSRTAGVQLSLERGQEPRMIMTCIVDTISGEKIDNAPAVG